MVGARVKKVRERIAAQCDSQRATEMKAGEKELLQPTALKLVT
jgi:hypothetical protein